LRFSANSSTLAKHKKLQSMEPHPYIRLSALNDMINDTISARFAGQRFWVLADITNHSYKADKKIHYFELVESTERQWDHSQDDGQIMGRGSRSY